MLFDTLTVPKLSIANILRSSAFPHWFPLTLILKVPVTFTNCPLIRVATLLITSLLTIRDVFVVTDTFSLYQFSVPLIVNVVSIIVNFEFPIDSTGVPTFIVAPASRLTENDEIEPNCPTFQLNISLIYREPPAMIGFTTFPLDPADILRSPTFKTSSIPIAPSYPFRFIVPTSVTFSIEQPIEPALKSTVSSTPGSSSGTLLFTSQFCFSSHWMPSVGCQV